MVLGSAGSGKTFFACVKTIMYALEHPKCRIGVFRQTLPSLRETAWREIREVLDTYKIEYKENKSNGLITLSNDSTISFTPTDDDRKLRSLNLDMVYIEQCEEITEEAFDELDLRIRSEIAQEDYGQMLIVVQPESKHHWLYKRFYQTKLHDDDYKVIHFSYLDNPYLPTEQAKIYEGLKETNPDKYRTHTLGEWITSSKQIFTNNWSVGFDRKYFEYYVAGVDFGWNNPSCFLLCGFYDDECYVVDEIYKTEMTNDEFIEKIHDLLSKYNLDFEDVESVYADGADPEKIEVFCRYGLNTYPSVKNVKAKIDTARTTKIHISENCPNLISEIPNYEWKRDKQGNILDEPKKINDHAVDALCYAIYGVKGELSKNKPASSFSIDEVYVY